MAHIVRAGFEIETLQETLTGHAIGQRTGAVSLQRGNDEILHNLDLGLPLQAGFRFVEGSFGLGDVEPGFVLFESRFDVADALKVFVELVRVGFGESTLHASGFAEHGVEDAAASPRWLLGVVPAAGRRRRRACGKPEPGRSGRRRVCRADPRPGKVRGRDPEARNC